MLCSHTASCRGIVAVFVGGDKKIGRYCGELG